MKLVPNMRFNEKGFYTWTKTRTRYYDLVCCSHCSNPFFTLRQNTHRPTKMCSKVCQHKYQSLKISGSGNHGYGKPCPFKGKHTKLLGKTLPHRQGSASHLWNATLTVEDRTNARDHVVWKAWRLGLVKERNFTCQLSGLKGGKLHVHHIIPWALDKIRRYDKDNCIVLTETIHKLFHKLYGTRNNKPWQWDEFVSTRPWER